MEIYKPSSLAMKRDFFFCGEQLNFPEGFDEYNAVRVAFNRRAFNAQAEMTECYEKQINKIEDILTKGVSTMERINRESAEFAISVLMYYGIEWVTPDALIKFRGSVVDIYNNKKESDYIDLERTFEHLIDNSLKPIKAKIEVVIDFQNNLSYQKQVQRASRSHWAGGGFGFKGAIKGAMMAGMMNAGTGIFRGIGDSFADARDARRVQALKDSVVDGAMPLANFNYIVKTYVYHLYEITNCYLLNSFYSSEYRYQGEAKIIRWAGRRDINEAAGKFSNYELFYKNGAKTADEVKTAILEYMIANIWDINALRSLYLLSESAADKESIINLTPYLGLQYEFANIALNIDADIIEDAEKRKLSDTELSRIRKEVEGRAELIDFLISSDDTQIKSRLEVAHYLNKRGFYIEKSSLGGAQEDYTATAEENVLVLSFKGSPVNGKLKFNFRNWFYDGDFTDGRMTGYGKARYEDGTVNEGEFKNQRLVKGKHITEGFTYEGTFQYDKETNTNYYKKGKLYSTKHSGGYEGDFLKFSSHGYGVLTYKNGNIYKGGFANNKAEGDGTYTTPEYEFVGKVSDGKMISGTVTYKNGESYIGEIRNDEGVGSEWHMHGKGTYFYKNGEVYEGEWRNDKKLGKMKSAEPVEAFDQTDIDKNKTMAGLAYIIFFLPLVACPDSRFGKYHANQGLVLLLFSIFGSIVLGLIPILGWILLIFFPILIIVFVVMGLLNGLNGKAKELPVIGKIKLLK